MKKISMEGRKFVEDEIYENISKLAIIPIFNDNPDDNEIYFNFSQFGKDGDYIGIIKNDANQEKAMISVISAWPDPIGWSGFNLSSCSALGLLPGQMTVLLRLLAQAR